MQEIERDVARISTLFPQVETEVIGDFMTNIPKEIAYLQVPLTLTHFYMLEDNKNSLKLKDENIQYANWIHDLFPIYSLEKILKKLKKYGNIPDRCRLVIRNILKGREEEINAALNAHQSFKIMFGKYDTFMEQNNYNSERNIEFGTNFSECRLVGEHQERDCDTPESTSVIDEPRESKNSWQTIIQENPGLIAKLTRIENTDETGGSEEEDTNFNDSSLLWEHEAPHLYLEEKIQPVESSEVEQSSEIDNCDNSFPISTEVLSSDETESHIKTRIKELDDRIFERDWITPPRIETSSESAETISSSVIIHQNGNRVNSSDILEVESVQVFPNFVQPILRTEPEETSPEPSRKKLKADHVESMENTAPEMYDLIETLAEITSESRRYIADYCLRHGIDVYRQPAERKMKKLIGIFSGNISDDSNHSLDGDADNADVVLVDDKQLQMEANVDVPENSKPPGNVAGQPVVKTTNNKVVFRVMEIFPDADPNYIRELYHELPDQAGAEHVLSEALIEKMLSVDDYPKRPAREPTPEEDVDLEDQVTFVSELLPDADPGFLRMKVSELTRDELKVFVAEALEKKDYPTLKEYLRKQQLSAQMRQYTVEFSVLNFVKLVPDPISTFQDPNRNLTIDSDDENYIRQVFKNKFSRITVKTIYNELSRSINRPYVCYKVLMKGNIKNMKSTRAKVELTSLMCKNIPLLQELAFIEHENDILSYIDELRIRKENERLLAKAAGLLLTCNCCFDDEVMPHDTSRCTNNCIFCRQCIVKSVEVLFGEGKVVFPCLGDCGSDFSLQTLQNVLPPNLFSKVAQKQAVAEVKAAGLEDLEFCPFCDFATIPPGPPETDKIFVCQNPDCLKESCRLCKEPSHVPLRCDEVEKDEEVKKRVYIENKMTEALLRKCWKCGISFYKEEGCNKMTCSCGALMCYICKQPVTNYQHFNGIGGDRHDLCPLYSDTNAINQQNVLQGAETAKEEIGVAGGSSLKHDPTSDVKKHFEERAKKLPVEPHMQHLQRLNQLAAAAQNARPAQHPVVERNVGAERMHPALLLHPRLRLHRVRQRHVGHQQQRQPRQEPYAQHMIDALDMLFRGHHEACRCHNCVRQHQH